VSNIGPNLKISTTTMLELLIINNFEKYQQWVGLLGLLHESDKTWSVGSEVL
jgi:hypothetical protein